MKLSIKHAVLAALAAGGIAGSFSAMAADIPSTGNGSLVLFVTNTTTHEVYARDLGLHMDDLILQGTSAGQVADPTFGAVNTINLSIAPIAADATLTSFLGTGATGEFTWNLIGGDSIGTTLTTPRRFALTSVADLVTGNPPSNTALGTLSTAENNFFNTVNTALNGASSVVTTDGQGTGQINVALLNGFFNQAPQTTVAALDSAVNFYVLTTSASTPALPSRVFVLNDLKLDASGLLASVAAVSEVPLPAGVWLFGSGLMGLLGVGRRRKQTQAA